MAARFRIQAFVPGTSTWKEKTMFQRIRVAAVSLLVVAGGTAGARASLRVPDHEGTRAPARIRVT